MKSNDRHDQADSLDRCDSRSNDGMNAGLTSLLVLSLSATFALNKSDEGCS